jgi:2-oxo-3-hexenedioate decarboxylase/2-keto-4-pentenoate hydratase
MRNALLVIMAWHWHTPAMDERVRDRGATLLAEAERTKTPITPLSEEFPELDIETAYAIQLTNVNQRIAAGAVVRGHKVGLTSKAMQEMLGVGEPDYGHLLDDMLFADGAAIDVTRFLQPRVEVEIAFLLHDRLQGAGTTIEQVLAATESVAPALEIIDSRIADWKITLTDTIADNASSAGVVLGQWSPLTPELDLRDVTADLSINGEPVASGQGSAVLGHPAASVAWMANKLAEFDLELEPGHIVMPGSCTKAFDVRAGDKVSAVYSGLGSVGAVFVGTAEQARER